MSTKMTRNIEEKCLSVTVADLCGDPMGSQGHCLSPPILLKC